MQEGTGKGITHSDRFRTNAKFSDRMRRIRVRVVVGWVLVRFVVVWVQGTFSPVEDHKKVQEDVPLTASI